MELSGSHRFASAAPQAVWAALHNDTILKNSLPNVDSVAWQGDSAITFSGGIGPIKGSGTAQVVEQSAPNRMKIAISRGGVNAALTVELAADGAGTVLTYGATADAPGPIGLTLNMVKGLVEGQVGGFFSKLESQIG